MKTTRTRNVKLILVVALFALVPVVLISGCIGSSSTITTPDEAGNAVANIGDSVQDISSTLNEIDADLGG